MRTLKSCQTFNRTDDVGTGGGDELVHNHGSILINMDLLSLRVRGTTRLRSDQDGSFGEDASVLKEIDHI